MSVREPADEQEPTPGDAAAVPGDDTLDRPTEPGRTVDSAAPATDPVDDGAGDATSEVSDELRDDATHAQPGAEARAGDGDDADDADDADDHADVTAEADDTADDTAGTDVVADETAVETEEEAAVETEDEAAEETADKAVAGEPAVSDELTAPTDPGDGPGPVRAVPEHTDESSTVPAEQAEDAAPEPGEAGPDDEPGAPGGADETRAPGAASPFGRHGTPSTPTPGGLRALGRALRPSASRPQIVVGVLCALLGFAVVVQVSQTQEDQLSSLRQTDLVRLLDDVTQRSEELEDQVSDLEATRDELRSGSGAQRAAIEVAEQRAQTQGILSGRLPAQGPGVEIDVVEGDQRLRAFSLFNVLEELRNAGAEAMEVNGVRLVTSSYFEDTDEGVVVDGQVITSPYRWTAIGDPSTLGTALEIPGGAMASLRSDGARTTVRQEDLVEVDATREPADPQYATPVPPGEDG